jgi:hypothetical protein
MNDRGKSVWWWLPAVVTAGLTGTMYAVAAESERGTRAGAEPEMAGIIFALPFFALFLVDVLCAMSAAVSESRVGRTWSLWCATVGAALVAGVVLAVVVSNAMQGYWSVMGATWGACLVAALLLPLAPVWLSHVRARPS